MKPTSVKLLLENIKVVLKLTGHWDQTQDLETQHSRCSIFINQPCEYKVTLPINLKEIKHLLKSVKTLYWSQEPFKQGTAIKPIQLIMHYLFPIYLFVASSANIYALNSNLISTYSISFHL